MCFHAVPAGARVNSSKLVVNSQTVFAETHARATARSLV